MNLKKLFPYISERLNNILMNFAVSTKLFYETVDDVVKDLEDAVSELPTVKKEKLWEFKKN